MFWYTYLPLSNSNTTITTPTTTIYKSKMVTSKILTKKKWTNSWTKTREFYCDTNKFWWKRKCIYNDLQSHNLFIRNNTKKELTNTRFWKLLCGNLITKYYYYLFLVLIEPNYDQCTYFGLNFFTNNQKRKLIFFSLIKNVFNDLVLLNSNN